MRFSEAAAKAGMISQGERLAGSIEPIHDIDCIIDAALTQPSTWVRSYEVYRPSSLYYLCYRREALANRIGYRNLEFTAETLRLFGMGTATHTWLQQEVFPKIADIIGCWRCLKCASMMGPCTFPDVCTNCGATMHPRNCQYMEVKLNHPSLAIQGRVDGIMGGDPVRLLEFKSCDPDIFEGTKTYVRKDGTVAVCDTAKFAPLPVPKDVYQLSVYIWLYSELFAAPNVQGRLCYFNKVTGAQKTFAIFRDDAIISDVTNKIATVRRHEALKVPLEKIPRMCPSSTCLDARRCPYSRECWA